MQVTVTTIIFGLPTGQCTSEVRLALPAATLTVRELIAHKVSREIEECLRHQRPGLSGEYLTPEELSQGAGRAATRVVADEITRAQKAFAAHDYMVVLDNRRLWKPDEEITLHPEARVEFIRILLPVGG